MTYKLIEHMFIEKPLNVTHWGDGKSDTVLASWNVNFIYKRYRQTENYKTYY